MNHSVGIVVGILLIAVPAPALAFVSCRDTTQGCTLAQLTQLSADASALGLSTQEHVAILQEIIAKLTALLSSVLAKSSTVTAASCLDLSEDLYIGKTDATTNGEVTKLQNFLIGTGYFTADVGATGYYGNITADAVMRWQKAHGMDFVNLKSGVGPLTRGKMRCGSTEQSDVIRVSWQIELVDPNAESYKQNEQHIAIDVTRADGSTQRYDIGSGYGCAAQDRWNPEPGKHLLGFVNCYYALSGVTFTAFTQNGKFFVEKGLESARDGSVQRTVLLEL